jgi:hypothetical protein
MCVHWLLTHLPLLMQYEMEDGDKIDAMLEQLGGCSQ